MNTPHKIPGAGTEPVAAPRPRDVHCMVVNKKKIGWNYWAFCSCGWIDCDASRYEVEIKARLHSFKADAS